MNPDLKPRELDLRLAQALGWTKIEIYEDNSGPPIWHGFPPATIGVDSAGEWDVKKAQYSKTIPHFSSDLNETNKVELGLTEEQRPSYEHQLYRVCGESWSAVIYATARQRTIALIAILTP